MSNAIRFSAPDWCFFPASAKTDAEAGKYYASLKKIGIDAVEMVPRPRRAIARAEGLEVINHGAPGMEVGANNRANHEELLNGIREAITEAAEDKIPHVIVFSGNRVAGINDGLDACAEIYTKALVDAKAAGITLIYEILNSFDHVGYEGDTTEYGFSLAARMDSPNFKVLYDLYHIERMGENPADGIRRHAKQIAHLHLAASPKRTAPIYDAKNPFAPDIVASLKAARDGGYNGYWGMEYLPAAGGDTITELAEVIDSLRSL